MRRSANRNRTATRALATCCAVASIALAAGCGSSASSGAGSASSSAGSAKVLKVAMLHDNALDNPYDVGSENALNNAIDTLGAKHFAPVKQVLSVPDSTKATQITEELFRSGYDVVVDSAGFGSLFYQGCAAFPTKHCIEVDPVDPSAMPANTSGFYDRNWEGFYLEGVAAGMLTKTGTLGWVGTYNESFENNASNSLALGCQSVRPDCKVRAVYTNSFFNPPAASEAAQTLLNSGVDVLAGYQDDTTVQKIAQAHNVWTFGLYLPSTLSAAPTKSITGTLMLNATWSRGILKELGEVLHGDWQHQANYFYGFAQGVDEMAPWGPDVPSKVREAVARVKHKFESGWTPYTGPIYDNTGKLRVPQGQTMSPEAIMNAWTWHVKGVVTSS